MFCKLGSILNLKCLHFGLRQAKCRFFICQMRNFWQIKARDMNMCLGQAKSATGLPLGATLLPMRHMSQEIYTKCCILSMKKTDDQKGKLGTVWFWTCFWACFFRKRDRSLSWCFQLHQAPLLFSSSNIPLWKCWLVFQLFPVLAFVYTNEITSYLMHLIWTLQMHEAECSCQDIRHFNE